MREEYVDYWKTHKASCVGLSKIGKGRWNVLYSNGTSKPACLFWNFIPSKFITHDQKGLRISWKRFKQ